MRLVESRGIVVRVVADVILVNLGLVAALTVRFLWHVGDAPVPHRVLVDYTHAYTSAARILTLVSVVLFWASGFYTRNRAYRGRYKALAVVQAVSASYLILGALSYFTSDVVGLPRAAFILAWGLTVVMLVVARLGAHLWAAIVSSEQWFAAPSPAARKVESVLVIGGDGYIGSALLARLLARGYRVRVLSLLLYGVEPIQELMENPRLEVVRADFRQVDRVVEAMRGIDAVVHLGAIVGDPACALDEELTIDVNLTATRMIAEVAKGCGVNRFIFASTCSVYGTSESILDERSALNPVSLYARSKLACERVLMNLADGTFAPVCLRFGTLYGLSGRTRFDLVVNLLAAKATVDGEITVLGREQWRPFLHVDDAAVALVKVLEAPLSAVRNETFNIGSDEQNYTIGQVGEMIHRMVPSARLVDLGPDRDRRNYRVSFAKVRDRLDFAPGWSLQQGVKQVIAAIRSGEVKDYRDPIYSNAKFLGAEGRLMLLQPDNNWAYALLRGGPDEPPLSMVSSERVPKPPAKVAAGTG
jgi:nucleoside-diphosphate-sugar epimerase